MDITGSGAYWAGRALVGPNEQAILLAYHFLLRLNKKNQLQAFLQQNLLQLYHLHCITTSQICSVVTVSEPKPKTAVF